MSSEFLHNFVDSFTRQVWAVHKGDQFRVVMHGKESIVEADYVMNRPSPQIVFVLKSGAAPFGAITDPANARWSKIEEEVEF